jgi:hypothetical protein
MGGWREIAKPIISAVLNDLRGEDERTIRKALRDAYPFGPRRYHPYKIWCDEVAVQLGTKKHKTKKHKARPLVTHEPDPNQPELFGA